MNILAVNIPTHNYTGISIMAVSKTGDIMGVRLNRLKYRDDADSFSYQNSDNTPKYNEWMNINDRVWREVDVFGRYSNVNRLLELKCVAVKQEYRDQGICKALYSKTRYLSIQLNWYKIFS